MKKAYSEPELTIHGDIEEITLASNAQNRDSPTGIATTAFPDPS